MILFAYEVQQFG